MRQGLRYHRYSVCHVAPNMGYMIACGSDFEVLNCNGFLFDCYDCWLHFLGKHSIRHETYYLHYKIADARFCCESVAQCLTDIRHYSKRMASICNDIVDLNIDTWPT